MDNLKTITQAAGLMKCSRQWVFYLIQNERLKAQNIGGIWLIKESDIAACDVRPRAKPNGHKPQARKKVNAKPVSPKPAGRSRRG